jgi:DNA repair exonuclease SbcCD ATPase subunit
MVKAFEIQRELSNQEYAQRTANIGEYLERSQADLEKRFKAFRLSAYILVGIPALSLVCGSIFLFFSYSALEKMAIDETLLSHVRPLVENYAQKSMQEQTESLLQLKKNSEAKINDLVANAVAQYRTETEKSFKELGEYKGYAASLKSELNESKSEVNSLQKEVSQLNRKIEGRFGFFDVLNANMMQFILVFFIIAALFSFLGFKYGRKTS